MSLSTKGSTRLEVLYPETDGEPMGENTTQYEWIVTIKEGLEDLFRDRPDVFVAGDLFWYPVEGEPGTRTAPDVMVVFGRPKGHRGSYMQWLEDNIAPQVVFEVLSPGNRVAEMIRKFRFYERFGAEEYYILDPEFQTLNGWRREGESLREIAEPNGWVSPRLGIRFDLSSGQLVLYRPDGGPFQPVQEVFRERREATRQTEADRQRIEQLEARLRQAGIDPDAPA